MVPSLFTIGEFGVDIFFAISGFIMAYITPQQICGIKGYARYLAFRFARIYPPYIVITLALTVVWFYYPHLFNNYCGNKVDVVASWLLLPQNYTPLLAAGWTLIHEQYFYFVSGLILMLSGGYRNIVAICWGLGLVVFNIVAVPVLSWQHPFLLLISSPFTLVFIGGFMVGVNCRFLREKINSTLACLLLAISLAVFLVSALYYNPFNSVYPHNGSMFRFASIGIPSVGIVAGFVLLDRHFNSRAFNFLGNESYTIYLVHLPVISLMYRIFSASSLSSSPVGVFLANTVIFVAVIFFSSIYYKVIELPLHRYLKRLVIILFQNPEPGLKGLSAL